MLPDITQPNRRLLTLNTRDLPVYKDVLVPGLDAQPLYLDPQRGVWCLRALFHPGVRLPTHYHTGSVHLWTLSGRWYYAEHPEQPQTAGCYLFEPGGSIHTFVVPEDNTEVTETLMVVEGTNVNFDPEGNYHSVLDASSILLLIDHLVQERGLEPARYIRPEYPNYTAGQKA